MCECKLVQCAALETMGMHVAQGGQRVPRCVYYTHPVGQQLLGECSSCGWAAEHMP